ncbi:MAG: hypothetical protein F6K10_31815 [Moorea sp. SIO2B7]|nr:hypothetical protein [Moorena sp. SIO2B7]
MASKDTDLKQRPVAQVVYLFFGGAAVGISMLLILYSFSLVELNLLNVGIATLMIILCGSLSSIFGIRFIDKLMDMLGASGL